MSTKSRNGNARLVLGIIGAALFGIPAVIFIAIAFYMISINGAVALVLEILAVIFMVIGFISVMAIISGVRRKALIGRLSKYMALFEPKTVISISETATRTGMTNRQIRNDLKAARKKQLHFDIQCDFDGENIIKGEATWSQYIAAKEQRRLHEAEKSEREKKLEDPDLAPIEAFKIDGNDMLCRIRAANIALPGEVISKKLDMLERTVGQIIRHIEQYPEKLSETRKLMSYHLPATLSIVEKYREYERLEFKAQSVTEAQEQIEQMLDTVDTAFKKYLEKLMEFDTLDVTTDIEVLKQMFEKDGLTEQMFEKCGPGDQ